MQKHIITVTINDLIKANARFDPTAERTRGRGALNVSLRYPDGGGTVGFEGRRDVDADLFVFTTTSESIMDDVTGDFNALGIAYDLKQYEGRGITVSVLEILKAGFVVCAPANSDILKVRIPDGTFGTEVEFKFRNDGTNLTAEYDGIDVDGSDKRANMLALIEAAFTQHKVWYEAQ
jgi:hypothetical protein